MYFSFIKHKSYLFIFFIKMMHFICVLNECVLCTYLLGEVPAIHGVAGLERAGHGRVQRLLLQEGDVKTLGHM